MGEINTRGMVRAKISSFPSGADKQCLTKSELLSTGVAKVNGNYGDNECPMINDVNSSKPINTVYALVEITPLGDYGVYIQTRYPVTSTIYVTVTILDTDGEFDYDLVINVGESYKGVGCSQVEVYNATCVGSPTDDSNYIYVYG